MSDCGSANRGPSARRGAPCGPISAQRNPCSPRTLHHSESPSLPTQSGSRVGRVRLFFFRSASLIAGVNMAPPRISRPLGRSVGVNRMRGSRVMTAALGAAGVALPLFFLAYRGYLGRGIATSGAGPRPIESTKTAAPAAAAKPPSGGEWQRAHASGPRSRAPPCSARFAPGATGAASHGVDAAGGSLVSGPSLLRPRPCFVHVRSAPAPRVPARRCGATHRR